MLAALSLNPNDFLARLLLRHLPRHGGARPRKPSSRWRWDAGEIPSTRDGCPGTWASHFSARRYEDAVAALTQAHKPINEVRGWLAASYAHAGRTAEARATLDEFLNVARTDMAVFPGTRLSDWEAYWHCALEYRDQRDFDHLFDALRKAGLED